jgi:hypothetical protein
MDHVYVVNQPRESPGSVANAGFDYATANSNDAIISYTALADMSHVIGGVAWSYAADPTNGDLTITDGNSNILFSIDITKGGPGFIPFEPGLAANISTDLIITLADGGVVGKVNALGHWEV